MTFKAFLAWFVFTATEFVWILTTKMAIKAVITDNESIVNFSSFHINILSYSPNRLLVFLLLAILKALITPLSIRVFISSVG